MSVYVKNGNIIIQSVSYIEPVFAASYIDIEVQAEVTMPDVLAVDIITPTDSVSILSGKNLTDTYSGFQDTQVIDFGKNPSDTITMVDDTDIDVWIEKILSEMQSVADAKAIAVTKAPFTDAVSPLDLKAYQLTKALAEVVNTPVDTTARIVNKVFADSISFTDVAQAFKLYIRDFNETLSVPDDEDLTIQQPKTEIAAATDNSFRGVNKPLTEGITLIDGMDGDLDFDFIKVVSELVAPLDAKVVDFQPTKADNVLTTSSGILAMQDYCDITYFLEDYVGISRTFT